jgi:hypothetical protein
METLPNGMVIVTKEHFFHALYSDPRDIMPKHDSPVFTTWETRGRQLWGWSTPGWKYPNAEKVYAIFPGSRIPEMAPQEAQA